MTMTAQNPLTGVISSTLPLGLLIESFAAFVLLACIRIWIKFVRTIISLQLFIIGIYESPQLAAGCRLSKRAPVTSTIGKRHNCAVDHIPVAKCKIYGLEGSRPFG